MKTTILNRPQAQNGNWAPWSHLTVLAILSVCLSATDGTAIAQKVIINGGTGERQIMTESFFNGTTVESEADYFGDDQPVMSDVIDVMIERAPHERFEWNKKFKKGGWTENSCAAAAENMYDELNSRGTLPEGWDVRQIGTLGTLTTVENAVFNQGEYFFSWGESEFSFDPLEPPSYAHSLSIVKSPDGNYYTIDNWSGDIQIKRVYPVDAEATFFSSDPNETEVLDAGYRLSGLDKRGRGWDEPEKDAKPQPREQFESQHPEISEPVDVEVLTSADPNDKLGLVGAGKERYIRPDDSFDYVIRFENMPDASAPAQEVLVRDTLDLDSFELSTFELGDIAFGDVTIDVPPGLTTFSTRIPLATPLEVLVDASLQPRTGIVTWRFTTLDTNTGDLPFDPLDGFLPPNKTSPEGEGRVTFNIAMKPDLPSGWVVRNQARIIFDLNEPIDTPVWANTIDVNPPTSTVNRFAETQKDSTFTVTWRGSDANSGVSKYDVYFSVEDGPFIRWQSGTYDTEATFAGRDGVAYSFFSVATDATGNREAFKTEADASTAIIVSVEEGTAEIPLETTLDPGYPNPTSTMTTFRYGLRESADVRIALYDLNGRLVSNILGGTTRAAGWHQLEVPVNRLASGVYFVKLMTEEKQMVRKVTVVR